jgi:hypothetical protein
MVRKIIMIVGCLCILFAAISCSSLDRAAIGQVKKAVLISVFADKRIDTSEFKGDIAGLAQFLQFDELMLQPMAESLKEDFFNKYTKVFPFAVIPEEEVINSGAYKSVDSGIRNFIGVFMSIPKGYKYIPAHEADARAVMNALGADAVIHISASYRLSKMFAIAGFGLAKVNVTLNVTCIGRDGKSVFTFNVGASSNNDIKFALNGVFDATQILPLCREATDNASQALYRWFAEQMAKAS